MPRAIGSPNKCYRWAFVLCNPNDLNTILWSKKYTSIQTMHEELQDSYTLSQLRSYAAKTRKLPAFLQINRLEFKD